MAARCGSPRILHVVLVVIALVVVVVSATAAAVVTTHNHRHRQSVRGLDHSNLALNITPPVVANETKLTPLVPVAKVNGTKCTDPKVRIEWRRMKDEDKKGWIDAVHCMHKLPSKMNQYFPAARHRYDDFVAFHINATGWTPGTHNNGYFLPFHRYVLYIWENTLAAECNYHGPTPWWDWSLDTPERNGSFANSPIWDDKLGFGGDGIQVKNITEEFRCVEKGPWAQYNATLTWKPKEPGFERCIERDFDVSLGERSSSPKMVLNGLLARDKFATFSELDFGTKGFDRTQGGPHTTGHIAVGGEMSNLFTSTNDPLFWIHHGGIDNFWWRWQGRNETRLKDARRSIIEFHNEGEPIPRGAKAGITSLDSDIFMVDGFAPVIKIREVVDTLNVDNTGLLCYKYDSDSYDTIP